MSRRNFTVGAFARLQSNAGNAEYDMTQHVMNSYVPPHLLGSVGLGGNSILSGVAHRNKQMNQFENLMNNGVDDEIEIEVINPKTGKPITTPFPFGGKMRYPNAQGKVRYANMAPVQLAMEIKKFEEDQTDILMDKLMTNDMVASYIIGMSLDNWKKMCIGSNEKGFSMDPELRKKMSDEMAKENCTIQNIESLVSGSITQTRALSKLRCIAKHYLKNVNLEAFDSMGEKEADMKTGIQGENKAIAQNEGVAPAPAPEKK